MKKKEKEKESIEKKNTPREEESKLKDETKGDKPDCHQAKTAESADLSCEKNDFFLPPLLFPRPGKFFTSRLHPGIVCRV